MEGKEEETSAGGSQAKQTQVEEKISGILRPDSSRFKATSPLLSSLQVVPPSPQPSADRLSVTFATGEGNVDSVPEEDSSDPKKSVHVATCATVEEMQRISITEGEDEGDEDDYSASACAIMQRRSSTRRQSRRKRRPSSPFGPEAESFLFRRPSAYTISSGEDSTAISMEDGGTQEQIYEKLKLHKEVLSGVKQQPWPLRRKIKLVRQAKAYVRRHEGALQERLAQSHSTKDVIARLSLFMTKKWQYFRRELINLQTWLIPWELRIKEIESHFGSAVASYFTFLRWLFWINFVMTTTLTAFVAIPEVLTADVNLAGERKIMLREERIKSNHLLTLWEFEGILRYSPFFYGWYTNEDSERGYRLPLAYFVTNLVVYIYSFVAILRKMAENSRLSKLTEKEDECAFSWKLFTGWDFMIGNPETAHNRMASIVLGFKEALLEEAEKQKDKRNWKVISMRIFVNISVMTLLALSAYAVVEVVARSTEEIEFNWWRQNEITIVMSLITYVFPIFFEILGLLENYHPRKQLRVQLARIMLLNLLNLYSLIFALFDKIDYMKKDRDKLYQLKLTNTSCTHVAVPCAEGLINPKPIATLASMSLVLMNVTYSRMESGIPETTLPPAAPTHEPFYLNPVLDSKTFLEDYNDTLEGFYNNLDYPHLDYDYYDHIAVFDRENETFYTNEDNVTTVDYTSQTISGNGTTDMSSSSETLYTTSLYTVTESYESTVAPDFNDSTKSSVLTSMLTTEVFTSTDDSTESPFYTSANAEPSTTNSPLTEEPFTEDIGNKVTTDSVTQSRERVIPSAVPSKGDYLVKCFERVCKSQQPEKTLNISAASLNQLDAKKRRKLRKLCWETMFGQELAKLTVMDLVLTIVSTLGMDFFRAIFVRFMNKCWCWDLEKQFPQYGDFKIAENILHLVSNQGMIWMGMFFSPGLTVLNVLKLGILMYLRSWAVLTCNVPHEVVFRASRSNNFYFTLLLTMLFLCVLPVGYAIVWVEPSWQCGPFSGYPRIYNLATKSLKDSLPSVIQRCLDYVASPGIVIPLIVLMTLIIYYMASLTGSLREANNDLKIQLRHERTEERRKLFKIVKKRHEVIETPLTRWKKILPAVPPGKVEKVEISKEEMATAITIDSTVEMEARRRKCSTTSETAEMTDGEQDSLPHDLTLSRYDQDKVDKEKESAPARAISKRIARPFKDSVESNSGECGNIPEIRINETKERKNSDAKSNERKSITETQETEDLK